MEGKRFTKCIFLLSECQLFFLTVALIRVYINCITELAFCLKAGMLNHVNYFSSETVLELLHEPSTTNPLKKSSTSTAAIPTVSCRKAKKTPSTKIKASTVKPAPSGKKRQKIKAEAKPHKPKQEEKIAHISRTTPAPPLPKKKSFHLTRTKKLLPKKAALAKEKLEKRRNESRLRSSS